MVTKKKKKKESIVEGRTPEEAEKSRKENLEFLRQREKAKQKALEAGATPKEAGQLATSQIEQKRLAEKQQVEQAKVLQEQQKRKEEAKKVLEEKGFFEEKQPERVELDIERRKGIEGAIEEAPIIGKSIGAITSILTNAARKGWLPVLKTKEEVETPLQTAETLREATLREIQKEELKRGISAGESFGALIESIPVLGSLANNYASGLIEDPKGNVQTIISQIDSERERASVLAEKVMTGKFSNPMVAYDMIEEIENNIARLEARIKLLSQTSAQLRADADTINKIEEKILRARERVFIAKQAAAGGMIAPATDSNLYLTLEELKKEKKES